MLFSIHCFISIILGTTNKVTSHSVWQLELGFSSSSFLSVYHAKCVYKRIKCRVYWKDDHNNPGVDVRGNPNSSIGHKP